MLHEKKKMELSNVLNYVVLGFVGIIAISGVLVIKRPLLFAVLAGNIISLGISLYLLNIPTIILLTILLSFEVYQLGKTSQKREEEAKKENDRIKVSENQKKIVNLVDDNNPNLKKGKRAFFL